MATPRRVSGFVVWVVMTSALTLGTLAGLLASPAYACHDAGSPWNTAYKSGTNGRGDRVSGLGMGVFDGNVDCGRVSSVFVYNSSLTRYVEVGWFESPQGAYSCIQDTGTGADPPRILAFAQFDGMRDCLNPAGSLSEGTQTFWVHDDNQDGIWKFYHSGTQVWTSFDMSPFTTGLLYDNGERLTFQNTAHADFDGLKRMAGQNWVAWGSGGSTDTTTLDTALSDDSGSHGCKYSNDHTAVKLNGTAC